MRHIWKETEEDFYKLQPINEKGVAKAEKELGVTLPSTYKKLILKQNGGFLKYNAHPSPVETVFGGNIVKIDAIMGIGKNGGILDSDYYIKEWKMPKNLVLLYGDGHLWIALDYRNKKVEPSIVFLDNDSRQIVELATSFDDFIEGLFYMEENLIEAEPYQHYSKAEISERLETADLTELIDLINMMSYSFEQSFVFEQYFILLHHSSLEVKETVASQVLSIIAYDDIIEKEWLEKIIDLLVSSPDENLRTLGTFIKADFHIKESNKNS